MHSNNVAMREPGFPFDTPDDTPTDRRQAAHELRKIRHRLVALRKSLFAAPLLLGLALLPVIDAVGPASAQTAASDLAYKLKTAQLFKIATEVVWPDDDSAVMHIQVLGDGPWPKTIKALQGRELQGKRIAVESIDSLAELDDPAILIFAEGSSQAIEESVSRLKGSPTLIVGEDEDTLERGGSIRLFFADQKVRFEVSVATLRDSRLSASSELLLRATRS